MKWPRNKQEVVKICRVLWPLLNIYSTFLERPSTLVFFGPENGFQFRFSMGLDERLYLVSSHNLMAQSQPKNWKKSNDLPFDQEFS